MQIKDLFKLEDNQALDKKVILICVLTALCLTMNKYLPILLPPVYFSNNKQLSDLTNWVLILFIFYFIVPIIFIKACLKEDVSNYGLKWEGAFENYWIYIFMLCIMIPLVAFFSTTASFQEKYPFYGLHPGEKLFPYFWVWQGLYFLQFFALEFFFRGFMVHGLKHRFGIYSVLVMTIPYCMIHFGKPLPETIAAIIAGIALGFLSFKSRSVLLGVCIHYSVGLMMDLASLYHKRY
jgi:uncharacterized protein